MAIDAAHVLRHTIAPDRFEQVRAFEQQAAASTPVETGRLMGMSVVVEQNPAADLQDAMEELSMQFEEKSAKKWCGGARGDGSFRKTDKQVQQWTCTELALILNTASEAQDTRSS